jgi:3-oxoacyl-(acyl-carrier-protein) synthase
MLFRSCKPLTGQGMEIAIRAALVRGRSVADRPGDQPHLCAHGIGVSDHSIAAEARAIRRTSSRIGPTLPVTSLKGGTGNMGAGNGGVEVIANLLTLREGFIPPTLHCDEPVTDYGLNHRDRRSAFEHGRAKCLLQPQHDALWSGLVCSRESMA